MAAVWREVWEESTASSGAGLRLHMGEVLQVRQGGWLAGVQLCNRRRCDWSRGQADRACACMHQILGWRCLPGIMGGLQPGQPLV